MKKKNTVEKKLKNSIAVNHTVNFFIYQILFAVLSTLFSQKKTNDIEKKLIILKKVYIKDLYLITAVFFCLKKKVFLFFGSGLKNVLFNFSLEQFLHSSF